MTRYERAMDRAIELTQSCDVNEAIDQVRGFISKCQAAHDTEALRACQDLYKHLCIMRRRANWNIMR